MPPESVRHGHGATEKQADYAANERCWNADLEYCEPGSRGMNVKANCQPHDRSSATTQDDPYQSTSSG